MDERIPEQYAPQWQQFITDEVLFSPDESRPGFFDPLSHAGLREIEVEGCRAWYGPGPTTHVVIVDRGEWVLQVRAPGTVDRDDVIRVAGSVTLAESA
jgi:hypothetical protein